MGVKIRIRNGKWWVFIDHHGQRKAKCIGTRAAAEKIKRELEARLGSADLGLPQTNSEVPKFADYSAQWLRSYADVELVSILSRPHSRSSGWARSTSLHANSNSLQRNSNRAAIEFEQSQCLTRDRAVLPCRTTV